MDPRELMRQRQLLALRLGAMARPVASSLSNAERTLLQQEQDRRLAQRRYQEFLAEIARREAEKAQIPSSPGPLPAHDDIFRTGRRGPAFITYGGMRP